MMHLSEQAFTGIARLMHEVAGLSFNPSKKPLIASRLAPRIQGLGLPGFEAYLQLIQSPGQQRELQVSIDLLTTNETYFFREPAHFERLEQEIKSGPRREVKVWCGASSYGDEPYTIAMVLADLCASGHVADNWSVVGTDISEKVLRHAVTGIFPLSRLQRVSPQRLKRYCLRGDDEAEGLVKMNAHLTTHVQFGQLNLCEPIDLPGLFDFIFLRNVMIYFDQDTKRQVVDAVLSKLRPGGLFFTGMAEGRLSCQTPLQPLASGVYRKPTHD